MTATHTGGPCFASTALDLHQVDPRDDDPRDIFIGDVCYRRVDPEYFAWLRGRMESARRRLRVEFPNLFLLISLLPKESPSDPPAPQRPD